MSNGMQRKILNLIRVKKADSECSPSGQGRTRSTIYNSARVSSQKLAAGEGTQCSYSSYAGDRVNTDGIHQSQGKKKRQHGNDAIKSHILAARTVGNIVKTSLVRRISPADFTIECLHKI